VAFSWLSPRLLLAAALTHLVIACGGNVQTDGAPDRVGGAAGTSPEGGSSGAGRGGAAGEAGALGTGGSTGGMPGTGGGAGVPGGVTCRSQPCAALEGTVFLPACCPEHTPGLRDGSCGLDTLPLSPAGINFSPSCQARRQPGYVTTECPGIRLDGFPGVELPGCCRIDSYCGYLMDNLGPVAPGLGCVQVGAFSNTPLRLCTARPHLLECTCGDGLSSRICVDADCQAMFDRELVCDVACHGNVAGISCSDNHPICRQ